MAFRIRKEYDNDQWAEGEKAYYKHLEGHSKSDGDFWKYFYRDFFHDGCVECVEIRSDLKTVVMTLTCPNVKRLRSDGQDEYLSVGFTCTFENVIHLHIEEDPPTQWHDVRDTDAIFLAAEINTSPRLETFAGSDEMDRFSSMLIDLLAHDSVIWMEIVFSDLRVEPKEPVAFSLMEASPEFDVPTWSPESM